MAEDACCDTLAEIVTTGILRHLADIAANEFHGITAVAHPRAMPAAGLGGATVDDCDEIICDDDSVLAFLCGTLRDYALLDDCHSYNLD